MQVIKQDLYPTADCNGMGQSTTCILHACMQAGLVPARILAAASS
jgi:hypothetical protein